MHRIVPLLLALTAPFALGAEPADAGPTVTLEQLKALGPGLVWAEAFVLDGYRCPPCPPRAMCKPCMRASAIFVAAVKSHPVFSLQDPPGDVLVLTTEEAATFVKGARYRLEVRVGPAHELELVGSQRTDR